MTRLAAPLGLVLGMGIAAALGPGLAEVIHHGGWNPFDEGRAMSADADPGCDPSGSAACGVFVQASHPYRGGEQ
jgi:hypothetical protein